MPALRALWFVLTVLFLAGLAGSSIVVVLFIIELMRTVLRGNNDHQHEPIPSQ